MHIGLISVALSILGIRWILMTSNNKVVQYCVYLEVVRVTAGAGSLWCSLAIFEWFDINFDGVSFNCSFTFWEQYLGPVRGALVPIPLYLSMTVHLCYFLSPADVF